MSDYNSIAVLICLNKDAGNALANISAAYPSPTAELETFFDRQMAALSSDPTAPVVWWAEVPSKATLAGACQAITDNADYNDDRLAYLRERGVTAEQWALAKSILTTAVFDRAEYSHDDLLEFVSANGYTIVEPTDG